MIGEDFGEIERVAGAIVRGLAPDQRRGLLRRLAREVQRDQTTRIARQRSPDGEPFVARKTQKEQKPGAYPVKFLYPKGSSEPRLVLMKSWVKQGPVMTGFDIQAGGIRSFFYDRVAKWLPLTPAEEAKPGGKYRRKGAIRRQAMFRKLRNGRYLRAGATDEEAWIGFTGRAAWVANVHQGGLLDRPSKKAKPIRYARRELLGMTAADQDRAIELLLEHVGAPVAR